MVAANIPELTSKYFIIYGHLKRIQDIQYLVKITLQKGKRFSPVGQSSE